MPTLSVRLSAQASGLDDSLDLNCAIPLKDSQLRNWIPPSNKFGRLDLDGTIRVLGPENANGINTTAAQSHNPCFLIS